MSCDCGNVSLPTGSNGLNGYNAFTVTTASFVLPAVGANVAIAVSASSQYTGIWAILGQIVYISDGVDAEYFEVMVAGTQTTMTVKNLGYVGTTVGNTFGSGSKVSPAGVRGAAGSGSNGTSLIGVFNGSSTLAGLAYATFTSGTVAVTAAQMNTNDDTLEIKAKFYYSSVTASGTANVRILIGGISVTLLPSFAVENALSKTYPYLDMKLVVARVSATTASIRAEVSTSGFGLGSYSSETVLITQPYCATYEIIGTGAITWASGNNIEFQGIVTDATDTIKLGFYEVTSIKKV